MPPPAMLKAFDDVVPGLARQIANAAEDERKHRHRWENKALWNDIFVESGGLLLGWLLAGICVALGASLAWKGNNVGAAILLGPPVLTMVRTMLRSSHRETDETPPSRRAAIDTPAPQSKKSAKIRR